MKKNPKNLEEVDWHWQKHTKNSCDVIKLSEVVGDDTNNEGVEKHKIIRTKTSIGYDFIKKKKTQKKPQKSFKIGKKMSLTFEDELNSSIFLEFTCLHRSHLYWIFGYHGYSQWTSWWKTLWNKVEEFH